MHSPRSRGLELCLQLGLELCLDLLLQSSLLRIRWFGGSSSGGGGLRSMSRPSARGGHRRCLVRR
jgi:hypothetical protein